MPTLPTGTVTFLFTDIEGSTQLVQELGAGYASVLAAHRVILREAFQRHSGAEVDTQGDAFFAAFASATDALACAVDIQRGLRAYAWPEGVRVRVRMGLHTGRPTRVAEGYVGLDVHRAARICAAGHGGQMLVAQPTRDLVDGQLPEDVTLRDLGEYLLKDLRQPEHIYQIVVPDLDADFPPLRALDRAHANLPVQPTPLLGRGDELARTCAYLRGSARLVTLTGPGGIGKTRLAVQAAAELADDFAHGVRFVPLANVSDPDFVAAAIAQACGVRESGSHTIAEALAAYLAQRHLLLVLDNVEQLLDAATYLAELLAQAPRLRILATSREPLHIRGEQEYPVPPLAVPSVAEAAHTAKTMADLSLYPAVVLFIERARAVKPDFAVTSANVAAIAEICARLDGLPLAIELAASRSKMFSPVALLPRLSNRLALLVDGPRDLPQRHRTLRATMEWSYDLLTPPERRLFQRLTVLSGSWTLEAAERICASAEPGDADTDIAVLDGVGSLMEKSLIRQTDDDRFSMLETIHDYGESLLDASGEAETLRRAHAVYFRDVARKAGEHLRGEGQREWLTSLEQDRDNMRAALAWCEASNEDVLGLQLATALWRFWYTRGYISEGRRWLERFLWRAPAVEASLRIQALCGDATLASTQNDLDLAVRLADEALALARAADDNDHAGAANALSVLGSVALHRGNVAQAREYFAQALDIERALDHPWGIARTLSYLGQCAYLDGAFDQARALFEESLGLLEAAHDPSHTAIILLYLGHLARERNDYELAAERYRTGLALSETLWDKMRIARGLEALATVIWPQGETTRAAVLLGAANALRDDLGSVPHPLERPAIERTVAGLRLVLGADGYARAEGEGRALATMQAIHLALGEHDDWDTPHSITASATS